MVRFNLNIKTCCLYVIWKKQDQIWAKNFCIPKNIHSRTVHLWVIKSQQDAAPAMSLNF